VRINKLSNARHDVIYWLAPLDDLYLKIAHRRVRSSSDSLHTQLYFTKLAAKHRKHRKQTNSKTQQKSEQTKQPLPAYFT